MKLKLTKLKAGQKGTVVEFQGGAVMEKRLSTMGISIDRRIEKLNSFALRGPVSVRVGRSVVALGHRMAERVLVEVEE